MKWSRLDRVGLISAGAERTATPSMATAPLGAHLRRRGADQSIELDSLAGTGLISAGAERTSGPSPTRPEWRAHLRRGGADLTATIDGERSTGSSPQARSGRVPRRAARGARGLISACAERTGVHPDRVRSVWAHLRRRGADYRAGMGIKYSKGSSPQARSGRLRLHTDAQPRGLISAGAERTTCRSSRSRRTRAHLRRRGADRRPRP